MKRFLILMVTCAFLFTGTATLAETSTDATTSATTSSGQKPDGTPPAMPDGQTPSGAAPGGQAPGGQAPGGQAPGDGQSGAPESYTAVNEYTEDTTLDAGTYESTGADENAIHVLNGAVAKLAGGTVSRVSSESTGGDNSSFYGVGAALLVTDGTLKVEDSTISTDAAGGAGVFAYGDGVAYVKDSAITTTQDTSGGIHVAGGGTLYAYDLNVETDGASSAAIRSDRGGGTMAVDGGTYTSNGVGSPAIYSTADISVNDATLAANGSEAICIEGLNTVRLYDSDLSGNMADLGENDNTWTVIVYQSMSGDSEAGLGTFQMVGGSLTSNNGGVFYTTNTESAFILSGVAITAADSSEYFLRCTGNSNACTWGTSGANGADCTFTGIAQEMTGDIIWDSISNLGLYATQGSVLTGAVVDDETNAGEGGDGSCNLYISDDSSWVVTGDSALTNLCNAGTIVDADGNTVSIVGTDGTVFVQGAGSRTITVSSYSTTTDLSGAGAADEWSAHEVAYE